MPVSTQSTINVGSSSIIQVSGLANADGAYQNNAVVTVTGIKEIGVTTDVTGITFPISCTYVASSNGVYEGEVPYGSGFSAGHLYEATVKAVLDTGEQAIWIERIKAKTRNA